jgi:hypothetical protein
MKNLIFLGLLTFSVSTNATNAEVLEEVHRKVLGGLDLTGHFLVQEEMCCCEYIVQDNLDPASHSSTKNAWISVSQCWSGYNDPLTIGRQSRPPGKCVSAAQCGKKRL